MLIFVTEIDLISNYRTAVGRAYYGIKTYIDIAYSAKWRRRNDGKCPKSTIWAIIQQLTGYVIFAYKIGCFGNSCTTVCRRVYNGCKLFNDIGY